MQGGLQNCQKQSVKPPFLMRLCKTRTSRSQAETTVPGLSSTAPRVLSLLIDRINNLHNQNTHARIEQSPAVVAWHTRGDNQGRARPGNRMIPQFGPSWQVSRGELRPKR